MGLLLDWTWLGKESELENMSIEKEREGETSIKLIAPSVITISFFIVHLVGRVTLIHCFYSFTSYPFLSLLQFDSTSFILLKSKLYSIVYIQPNCW